MGLDRLRRQIAEITGAIAGAPLDAALAARLNRTLPPGSPAFEDLAATCRQGIAEGWLCQRAAGGLRFGRALKPGPETHGFSVDVVEMDSLAGPHHRHPKGEIDLVIPLDPQARFDGAGAGWVVYGPDSAHSPTVTGGKAIVLYLLPDGEIDFTRS